MMNWVKAFMVFIGLFMLILGVSVTDDVSLWISAALALPGLALMFVFGVMMEDERDY